MAGELQGAVGDGVDVKIVAKRQVHGVADDLIHNPHSFSFSETVQSEYSPKPGVLSGNGVGYSIV